MGCASVASADTAEMVKFSAMRVAVVCRLMNPAPTDTVTVLVDSTNTLAVTDLAAVAVTELEAAITPLVVFATTIPHEIPLPPVTAPLTK